VEEGTQGLHYCRLEEWKDFSLSGPRITSLSSSSVSSSEGMTPTGEETPISITTTITTPPAEGKGEVAAARELAERGKSLVSFIVENTSTSVMTIERQFGPMPSSSSLEDYSLWLTAISPLSEEEKFSLLLSRDTHSRLKRSVAGLEHYLNQLNSRRRAASMISGLGNSVRTATSSLTSLLSSLMMGGSGGREEVGEGEGEEEEETLLISTRRTEEVKEEEDAKEEENGNDSSVHQLQDEPTEREATWRRRELRK
jgi:hypothetical protein